MGRFLYDITLDFHGYSFEEAIFELEKVIYSGSYSTILVIHGHGNGILRQRIREYFKNNRYIKDIYFGEELNLPGGSGVTLIEI